MKVLGIIIFVALACFVVWLVVDTVLYVIRKVKEKKKNKEKQDDKVEVIDTTNKDN